mmetsp:Transcript_37280/g.78503  ORF Transcript_37280/g.78503 Transcript_37280/m.78503 type:complete len:218 (+) Transcript_37280:621-1274(+)
MDQVVGGAGGGQVLEDLDEAKVGDEDVPAVGRGEQDVLGLDVAVDDLALVHKGEHLEQLPNDVDGLRLGEVAARDDAVEELAARRAAHHEVDALGALDELKELDDVGMAQRREGAALLAQLACLRAVEEVVLENDLDGERGAHLVAPPLRDHAHRREGAAADLLAELVHLLKRRIRVDHDRAVETKARRTARSPLGASRGAVELLHIESQRKLAFDR